MVDFVKGHMGGDEVILLNGRQLSGRYEPHFLRSTLMAPSIRGREVGILYPPRKRGDISVKIYELSSEGPIPMCGGLTQVLGKALVETELAKRFSIRVTKPRTSVVLETDSGTIPIHITFRKQGTARISTEMRDYVEKCQTWGSKRIYMGGIPVERFGLFYFMDLSDLAKKYPHVDWTRNNHECLRIVEEMRKENHLEKIYGVVKRRRDLGDLEAAFRYAPPDALALEGEEFACGTGSTTAALYELSHGRLPVNRKGYGHLVVKLLSRGVLPVDQQTEVGVQVCDGRAVNAWFSHNHVKIVAEGRIWI